MKIRTLGILSFLTFVNFHEGYKNLSERFSSFAIMLWDVCRTETHYECHLKSFPHPFASRRC